MDIRDYFSAKALAGEIAVVTGGGSGIGYAIARDLAACGADVVITSRSGDRLEAAAQALARDTGVECGTFSCDVREEADVAALHDYVTARHGAATIVVNNAAANFFTRAERTSRRALDTIVSTDLNGTFHVTRAFVGDMIAAGRGHILSITLPLPERGLPGFGPCGAAKAAIVSLTASWAYEWGPSGIRVNAIAPGPIPTDGVARNMLNQRDTGKAFASFKHELPLRRLGVPDDVSAMAVYLCSPLAAWITGTNVVVDGGCYLNA